MEHCVDIDTIENLDLDKIIEIQSKIQTILKKGMLEYEEGDDFLPLGLKVDFRHILVTGDYPDLMYQVSDTATNPKSGETINLGYQLFYHVEI